MKRTLFAVVSGVGALALLASACGGPAGNGVSAKSASGILAAARAAADGASSLHVVVVMSSGSNEGTFEFDERSPSTAEANVGLENGQRYTILQVGSTAYIKGNAAYLAAHGEAAHATKLSDECIETAIKPSSASSVGVYPTVRQILSTSLNDSASTDLTKGATATVDGQSVIALKGAKSATLYVATTGTAYPVKLTTPAGSITFSGWGESVSLAPFSPCLTLAQANKGV